MIKLPVVLVNHQGDWREVLCDARLQIGKLHALAQFEPQILRPTMLLQAQDALGEVMPKVLKKHVIDIEKIPADDIAIAAGKVKGLQVVNLMAGDFLIRCVITVEALKKR